MDSLPKLLSTLRKYGVIDFAQSKDGSISVKFGALPPADKEEDEKKPPKPDDALALAKELGLVGEAK